MASSKDVNEGQSKSQLKREISFFDIFFMSMGGQAPFLSLLSYGTAVFTVTLLFSPITVIIGTIVVLFNGIAIYYLSSKFTMEGGYYTYAFYGLSKRLGLETGWMYLFYSILYGMGYIAGGTFVLKYALGLPPFEALFIILIPALILLVLGIRPSTKYAIAAASLEVAILVAISLFFLNLAKFSFYDPFVKIPPASNIVAGVLFAIGLPTGYGSITPISGEVKDAKKAIGRTTLAVIITGGLLIALVVYSLLDAAVHVNFGILSQYEPIIDLVRNYLGLGGEVFLLFAAINDGILASLAFMTAASRTLFTMASHGFIPGNLDKISDNKPLRAVLTTAGIFALLSTPLLVENPYLIFLSLGTLAGLGNLFVHASADFSLIKISLKRLIKRLRQFTVGIVATIISVSVLVYSIVTGAPDIAYIFFGWIIAGFLYSEILNMTKEEEEEE
ncbi:amino acid permease [Sulfolobales archaeon HS-7]|nr:amino acid permease [Sulfolobales archaeon HS-7]